MLSWLSLSLYCLRWLFLDKGLRLIPEERKQCSAPVNQIFKSYWEVVASLTNISTNYENFFPILLSNGILGSSVLCSNGDFTLEAEGTQFLGVVAPKHTPASCPSLQEDFFAVNQDPCFGLPSSHIHPSAFVATYITSGYLLASLSRVTKKLELGCSLLIGQVPYLFRVWHNIPQSRDEIQVFQ